MIFPIVLLILYIVKIRSSIPLPDFKDEMTVEDIMYLYNSNDIEKIKNNAYTKTKHQYFMNTYGVIIEGIKLDKLKKPMTFLIGFLKYYRQIFLAFGVVYFRESPIFLIFMFKTSSLIVIGLILHFKPYEDMMKQNVIIL